MPDRPPASSHPPSTDRAPTDRPLSIGRAFVRWLAYSVIFIGFGGIGAGVTALAYLLVVPEPFSDVVYAAIFAGCGFIAYRLARHVQASWAD